MSDSVSLFSLLNIDPAIESDVEQHYNDAQVQQYLLKHSLEAKERWECVCEGVLHKNISPLSMACSLGASLPVVMLIASSDPSSLSQKDNFGLTPLHFSCLFGGELKVMRFLITKAPTSLKEEDHAGQLPLHIALWKRAPVDIVALLLDKYPDACKVSLDDGRLPLHIACSNQASSQVVEELLKLHPNACQQPEKEGGWLPLHYACRNDASLPVIQSLLHTFPQSATIAQTNGWVPLHLACANQADMDVVSLILLLCPEAAMCKDEKGYLPLHIACKYQASVQVVERLLDVYMDAAKVQGTDGSLPLHLACSRQSSVDVVESLVESFPGGLQVKNNAGHTPLQVSRRRDEEKKKLGTSTRVLNHDSLVLLSPSSRSKMAASDSIPFDRKICSVVLRNALLSKTPKTAVPLSLTYLRKCTRKFSDGKNKIVSDNMSDLFRGLDMKTCTGFGVQRFRRNVLLKSHEELVHELEELSNLEHPNLIRLLGYCLQETPREPNYLVYELAEGGTLASLLSSSDTSSRSKLDWRRRIQVGASIVSALAYLSSKDRLHESLRPETICFWEGYDKVLLTDYGNSRLFQSQQYRDASVTSPYAAPEFLDGEFEFDESCQVYSVGFILKALLTGHLPDEDESPGISAQSLIKDTDPMAGDWDARVLKSFASLTESCMTEKRDERPTLKDLLEDLLRLEQDCEDKVASAGQVLGALLHVEQVKAEKEEAKYDAYDDLDTHSHDGSSYSGGTNKSLTIYASCQCSRKNVRGVVCNSEDRHFCCDKCFREHVNEQLGASTIVCQDANCDAVYSAKQIHDHVEEKLFYDHISEAERVSFLEDLWGRGALRVQHARQNQALTALNALASRDHGPPEFPPLCILCLVTSRRGGSRVPNPFGSKRRFLLYFVCAFSKQPVKAAIKISRTRKWLRKAAPALKSSLVALDVCVSQSTQVQMTHDAVAKYMSMPVMDDEINQFADETWESVVDTFALYGQDPSGKMAQDRLKEARKVTKGAYTMLSELASSYPDWTKEMEFATNKSGVHAWVKNENAEMWRQLE